MIAEYFLMGVIAPSFLNLLHLVLNVYIVVARGNVLSLGFTGISFLTKTMGMIYLVGCIYIGIRLENICSDTYILLVLLSYSRSICDTTLYGKECS